MLIKDILFRRKDDESIAVVFQKHSHSYYEIYTSCKRSSDYLMDNYQDNLNGSVCIFLSNSYQYVEAFFTTMFMERVAVPININSTETEIISALDYCDVTCVITNNKLIDKIQNVLSKVNHKVILFNIDNQQVILSSQTKCFKGYLASSKEDDIVLLIHTSGSVSMPKRVMLSHKNLSTNVNSIIASLELTQNDTTLIIMPLFLISACTSQMLTHLTLGAKIIILEQPFVPYNFYSLMNEYNITNFTCVPTILSLITMSDDYLKRLPKLNKICFGGAPTSKVRIQELIDKYPNVNFVQMYGQTEASARLTHLLPVDFKKMVGSVGKAIPDVEIKIVNDEDIECKPGEIGQITAMGENIMLGYYKNEEETRKILYNGYLHTGDLGFIDEDGFLYVTGRKKNVIISGGINIYPEQVEEVISDFPSVKLVKVYAKEDEMLGEVLAADIIVNDSFEMKQLIEYCNNKLSQYKIPKYFNIVDNILLTKNGKIKR